MIGVIDYGAGNLRNVLAALERLGVPGRRMGGEREIAGADALILPGVGRFGAASAHLERAGLVRPLRRFLRSGRPFLGICLGMQLLFEASDEDAAATGLGVFPGRVVALGGGRSPRIGWTRVGPGPRGDDSLFEGLPESFYAYFAHSYAAPAGGDDVAALAPGPPPCAAAVRRGDIWGVQFHPEKSGALGLRLLENFVRRAGRSPRAPAGVPGSRPA